MTPAERVDALLHKYRKSVNRYSIPMLREDLLEFLCESVTLLMEQKWCMWTGYPHNSSPACLKPATGFIHACPVCPEHAAEMLELDRLRESAQDGCPEVLPADSVDLTQPGCASCESRQEDHFLIVKPPTP